MDPRIDSPQPLSPQPLSPRELEVLRLIVAGRSNLEIADLLAISVNTVQRHVSTIYAKIEARDRAGTVDYAAMIGLIPLPGLQAPLEKRIRRRQAHAFKRDK